MYSKEASAPSVVRGGHRGGFPDVAQDDPRAADNAGQRVPLPETAHRESLAQLVLCRSKIEAREALLLREVFPEILASHHD